MQEKQESEDNLISDVTDIGKEIDELAEEVKELKDSMKTRNKIKKSKEKKDEASLDYISSFEYLSELLNSSTESIITEMKSEFFRLFNFLTSMLSVTPNEKELKMLREKDYVSKSTYNSNDEQILSNQEMNDLEREKKLLQLLLEERESLIYELSDQLVAIENEKKELEETLSEVEKDKQVWLSQKHVLEKLVQTDPRFNIINLLRRMGVIAPIQLSFVLGVSLSQTKKYIRDLEKMEILKMNEDETVSLHPTFDEETMNIKLKENNN